MRNQNLDRDWIFRPDPYNYYPDGSVHDSHVNLPHDYMVASQVTETAPGRQAMGYYTATVANYTKHLTIPAEWANERVTLRFDGVMMNASVDVNGSQVGIHHYGYTPFEMDLTDKLLFGEENRVTINVNPSMQPNSRWYTGAGILRSVELVHTNQIHVANDGIFFYTKEIDFADGKTFGEALCAHTMTDVKICNHTTKDRIVRAEVLLCEDGKDAILCSGSAMVLVKKQGENTAHLPLMVETPKLWSVETPNLYQVTVRLYDMGEMKGHILTNEEMLLLDTDSTISGIRTIRCDARNGLRINGRTIKLKGGCVHHDNGIIGAISLYDSECRKLDKLKSLGFNAIRMAHNPPSSALLEACDRMGMYVYNEAFDAWEMAKQPGDYNQFFTEHWQSDLKAFVERDRNHPCILFWSTGNEIIERGGLGDGFELAGKLADYVRSLDSTRLVSNALCGFWGEPADNRPETERRKLDELLRPVSKLASSERAEEDAIFEFGTEPYTNSLDVVGLNYYDGIYEKSGVLYPERTIVGTESFPMDIDLIWPLVEKLPYILGDFTWTCYDYIGEAGLGKSIFVEEGDPRIPGAPWNIGTAGSEYPWRLSNDADFDLNGIVKPQGYFRSIVWGSKRTALFTQHPKNHDKIELTGRWAWPIIDQTWTYPGFEEKLVKVVVYSQAPEVVLYLNDMEVGRAAAGKENRYTAIFQIPYAPGTLTAVSMDNGVEISRDTLETVGSPKSIRLYVDNGASKDAFSGDLAGNPTADTIADNLLHADGHQLCFVMVEILDANGRIVPDAEISLQAQVSGAASLQAFGSANPITKENYTTGTFTTYKGRAMAVLRAGYETGTASLSVSAADGSLTAAQLQVEVV